jgi:hypothetical protein
LGVDAAIAFRTTPEKFSPHLSIAIPSGNSGSNGISSSSGCWKEERHVMSMSTERWYELGAEHEVIYIGDEIFLVITMSKLSGVAKGLY